MDPKKFEAYIAAAREAGGEYAEGYLLGLVAHDRGESPSPLASASEEHAAGYGDGLQGKAPRGAHGNVGNQNAAGDLELDSWLQVRVNSRQKARWVKAAQRDGMKLSGWVTKTLDEASTMNRGETKNGATDLD